MCLGVERSYLVKSFSAFNLRAPNVYIAIAGTLMALSNAGATRAQDGFYEVETKYIFGFTEGSGIGLEGEKELSAETVARIGKANGRYWASGTKLEYELAWVRTMLKGNGYITNSQRGIWALGNRSTDDGILSIPNIEIEKHQQAEIDENWKSALLRVMVERLDASAFERLIQRILREKGFTQVEVTGRTNDGGIDGKGIAKINGILSFHIVFQCKRYQGSVSASQVRDFRGAMVGRTDKGLLITTGSFTREAIKEANREGAPAIDLIDGEKLADQLKELSLGVSVDWSRR